MRWLLVTLLLGAAAFAATKQSREWKQGKVLSFDTHAWVSTSGSTTTGHIGDNGDFDANTTSSSWKHVTYYLTLNAGDYTYFAQRTLSWRFQHVPHITENDSINYVLDGNHLIVQSDDGKEFKMDVEKRRKN